MCPVRMPVNKAFEGTDCWERVPVRLDLQNLIFRYFMWLMSERITEAKNAGHYQVDYALDA